MCDEEVAALVVDNGSGMCKVSINLDIFKYCKILFKFLNFDFGITIIFIFNF